MVSMSFLQVGLDDEDAILPKKDDVKTSSSSSTAIFKQTVRGNSSTDTVTIDYVEPDGTRVTQLTDFRMRAQVTRVILLGEEELNEPAYQVIIKRPPQIFIKERLMILGY